YGAIRRSQGRPPMGPGTSHCASTSRSLPSPGERPQLPCKGVPARPAAATISAACLDLGSRRALPVVGLDGRLVRDERGVGVVVEVGGSLEDCRFLAELLDLLEILANQGEVRVLDPVGGLAEDESQQLRVLMVILLAREIGRLHTMSHVAVEPLA